MSTDLSPSFGERLRQLREFAGLTQEQLSERAGITAQAIGALERGDRKRPYPHTVHALATALGIDQAAEDAFARLAKQRNPDTVAIPPGIRSVHLAVPPTSMFGRDDDCREVAALLRRSDLRLLTMTGPGGVGKTRLAANVAVEAAATFPDKVVSVSLVPLTNARLVLATIAEAMGVRETPTRNVQEALWVNLANKQMLLVLDNFEHVLEAAPEIAELLIACPGIKILATSRAPLRLRGEQEFPVLPLDIPHSADSAINTGTAGDFASIVLFTARAQDVNPGFVLTDDNVEDVAEICRRLDGLPLAIELAAARIRLFSPEALLARLSNRLSLLSGGARDLPDRQRTMRDAIAWSHDLCSHDEQLMFRKLAVFAGGATLDAIEETSEEHGDDPDWALDVISALVNHSLVIQDPGIRGEPRFRMLETIRAYASERLDVDPRASGFRDAHASHVARLAELMARDEYTAAQSARILALEPELDNVRAALDWLIVKQPPRSQRTQAGIKLAGDMVRFWDVRGYLNEEQHWLERALEAAPADPSESRAFALASLGVTYWLAENLESSQLRQQDAIDIWRDLDDPVGLIRSLWFMGLVEGKRGNGQRILELAAECEQLVPRLGVTPWNTVPINLRGFMCLAAGDGAGAREWFSFSREYHLRHGFTWAQAWLAELLGQAALLEGDFPTVLSRYQQSLIGWLELGDVYGIMDAFIAIATEATRIGIPEVGANLLGVESVTRIAIGERITWKPVDVGAVIGMARAAMDADRFEIAFRAGRAMSVSNAAELALSVSY